jgi:hypothetical protein
MHEWRPAFGREQRFAGHEFGIDHVRTTVAQHKAEKHEVGYIRHWGENKKGFLELLPEMIRREKFKSHIERPLPKS